MTDDHEYHISGKYIIVFYYNNIEMSDKSNNVVLKPTSHNILIIY